MLHENPSAGGSLVVIWSLHVHGMHGCTCEMCLRRTQCPGRHNSVALALAIAPPRGAFTEMGLAVDADGNIIDPIRVPWTPGSLFTTPPGAPFVKLPGRTQSPDHFAAGWHA